MSSSIVNDASDLIDLCVTNWANTPAGAKDPVLLSREDAMLALRITSACHMDQVATRATQLCVQQYPELALYVRPKPRRQAGGGYYMADAARKPELVTERTRLRAMATKHRRCIASYGASRNGPAAREVARELRASLRNIERALEAADRAV